MVEGWDAHSSKLIAQSQAKGGRQCPADSGRFLHSPPARWNTKSIPLGWSVVRCQGSMGRRGATRGGLSPKNSEFSCSTVRDIAVSCKWNLV